MGIVSEKSNLEAEGLPCLIEDIILLGITLQSTGFANKNLWQTGECSGPSFLGGPQGLGPWSHLRVKHVNLHCPETHYSAIVW